MILVIVFDGLIGSGKTTGIDVLEEQIPLATNFKVVVVKEPVDLWKENGRLGLFYDNMKRRSYQFQTRVFHDRVRYYQRGWKEAKKLEEQGHDVIILMERSIFSDRIFADILHEQELMDATEMEDYIEMWTMWTEVLPKIPDHFVYFRPSLEIVMERLRKRNRSEEAGVSEDYQNRLMEHHDAYYDGKLQLLNGKMCPMHTFKTDFDYRDSEEGVRKLTAMFVKEVLN